MLARSEFKVLSNISQDIAQVLFASVVITPIVAKNTDKDWLLFGFGMGGSLVFWIFSLLTGKKGKI